MTFGTENKIVSACRADAVKPALGFLVLLGLVVLTGCKTVSLEDAAPKAMPESSTSPAATSATSDEPVKTGIAVLSPIPVPFNRPEKIARKGFVDSGIASGGKFPNLGTKRDAALPQLTPAEANAMKQEFQALKQDEVNGEETEAAYRRRLAELRSLANTHASDAEAEITK